MSLIDINSTNGKDSLNVNKQNTIDKLSFFFFQKIDSSSILLQLATPQVTPQVTHYHCLQGPFSEPSAFLQLLSTLDSVDTIFFQ